MRKQTLITLLTLAAFASVGRAQSDLMVDVLAQPTDPGFGMSIFNQIKTAVAAAQDGDRISVAPGVYAGDIDLGTKNLILTSACGAKQTFIECFGSQRGLLVAGGQTTATVIAGFTICNGRGTPHGGGMAILSGSDPLCRDLIFRDCQAADGGLSFGISGGSGGALLVASFCQPRFEDCSFIDNRAGNASSFGSSVPGAGGWGGAVAIDAFSDVEFRRCHFEGNRAGMHTVVCEGTFVCVLIVYGRGGDGGAISVTTSSSLRCLDCVFESNRAEGAAGSGGAVRATTNQPLRFERCRFLNNWVADGVFSGGSTLGASPGVGGAIAASSGLLTVHDSLFVANEAGFATPDPVSPSAWFTGPGGAIYTQGSLGVRGCTFVDNVAYGNGDAIFTANGPAALIEESLFRQNSAHAVRSPNFPTHQITYQDVASSGPIWGDDAMTIPALGVSQGPIQFEDAAAGDYRLVASSVFRDTNLSARSLADLSGQARVLGAGLDLGALEAADPQGSLSGTPGEALRLRVGVNGFAAEVPRVQGLEASDDLLIELFASDDTLWGELPFLVAESQPVSSDPVTGPLRLALLNPLFLENGFAPIQTSALPPEGLAYEFTVPPGLAGDRVVLQGAVTQAASGNAVFSDAHRLIFF